MLKLVLKKSAVMDDRWVMRFDDGPGNPVVMLHEERVWAPGLGECGQPAASFLHALELGVAAAARWIAVDLLDDPAPPPVGEERVYGVGLVLAHRSDYCRLQLLTDLQVDDLGGVYHDGRQWNTSEMRDMNPPRVVCATKEQALAVLVEHAHRWIAAALAKEAEREEEAP